MRLDEATVLIVDDEPILREVCTFWLKQGGCSSVFTAADGLEALMIIEERKIDVLITDIHMPTMGGVELIRTIRKKNIPVQTIFFMSAYMGIKLAELGDLTATKFLEKPFTAEIMLEAVTSALAEASLGNKS